VRELIETGDLKKNIARLVAAYRARLAAMRTCLQRELPQAVFESPQGGFFFWVHLPGVDAGQLRDEARDFNVGFRPGILFSCRGGMHDFVRLCFTFYDEGKIEEGIWRLKQCLEVFLK